MSANFFQLDVLLVEPSPVQMKIIRERVTTAGIIHIREAETMQAALEAMQWHRPDVVISALYLPDGDGTALVKAMRATPELQQTAFVLVSSETRPQALDEVRQSGVCGILPKPFSGAQLQRVLTATLDYLADEQAANDDDIDYEALRVLLVDDSPNARRFMRRVLTNLGLSNIVEAGNGREAVSLLEQTMFDLVVTDYNMPEMDGRALVEYVRGQSWQASVPILMVTSESDMGRLAAVEQAGVSGICDKPFEPATIRGLLRGALQHAA
ncbi:response regulator transcription factor [Methyloversatilis thermotolerans]|uniref:response regulator transcription factor n=1 Tax=Methyloversatilis thermotolerans TaxID=1346290 RepID=UPI00036FB91D|nr:response regulator [Methyloversatilis thermotolerans]